MDVDSAQSKTNTAADSGEVIKTEEEEILVYVNVDDGNDDCTAEDLQSFKVLGLDTDEPIVQVGDKFFGGRWDEVVGTAVFFKETTPQPKRCYFSNDVPKPLKYIGKTQKSLNLKRAFITDLKSKEDESETVCDSTAPEGAEVADTCKTEELTEVADNNTDSDKVVNSNGSSDATNEITVKVESTC